MSEAERINSSRSQHTEIEGGKIKEQFKNMEDIGILPFRHISFLGRQGRG